MHDDVYQMYLEEIGILTPGSLTLLFNIPLQKSFI